MHEGDDGGVQRPGCHGLRDELYHTIFEVAGDAIFLLEGERVADCNGAAERMLGLPRSAIVGVTPLDLSAALQADGGSSAARSAEIVEAAASNRSVCFDWRFTTAHGLVRDAEVTLTRVGGPDSRMFLAVLRDVTERRAQEEALRQRNAELAAANAELAESQAVLRQLFDTTPGIVALTSWPDAAILDVNAVATLRSDRTAVLGKTPYELGFWPSDEARVAHTALLERDGRVGPVEIEARTPSGEARFVVLSSVRVDFRGRPCVLSTGFDVTELRRAERDRRRLEAQLEHAAKMEVVGRLAGGVAHDFNNILTIIQGYADLLLARLGDADPARPDVTEVQAAARRGAALTAQLLAFSRREEVAPRIVDLNALVVSASTMLRRLLGEDVALVWTPGTLHSRIRMDPGQMDQILLNLAVNARDAMTTGGRLTLATEERTVDDDEARLRGGVAPGSYVVLVVRDTGAGMSPEVRARVFEPFFTTKPKGRGTGLGLSTVQGAVQKAGGFVALRSALGEGTEFELYFPAVRAPADETPAFLRAQPLAGTETVLVCEDEPEVRHLAERILTRLGYRVLASAGGREALALATAPDARVDLVLTDVVMPGMSGPELAAELRARRPDVRVLYMSGYTEDVLFERAGPTDGRRLLRKPFTLRALATAVRGALGTTRS